VNAYELKATIFIPPVVALVIAGSWLTTQRRSISILENESTLLRKHIAAARTASVSADPKRSAKPTGTKSKDSTDWKKVSEAMLEMQTNNGMGDMREMIRMHQRMQAMSKEEIVAALDEIAALDLTPAARAALEQMLLEPLVDKDPELALSRFSGRFQDDLDRNNLSWRLADALGRWAKKDPGKATAWLDQEIAAGNFDSKALDGKNQARVQFEGRLISILLAADLEGAGRRLAGLPEDQRAEALQSASPGEIKEENQKAYADLVRSQVPENERNQVISRLASNLVSKGYPEVTACLDRIAASPEERKAAVEQAATSKIQQSGYQKTVTSEDIDAMREWAESQSPGSADATTGKALARTNQGNGKFKFEDASALAVKYHEASGNDEVLVNFLGGWEARQHKEEATRLAEKISDVKSREKILNNLR
jgi:predicted kinase